MQNNEYFSECITLERGVRQGCPLSFPLYCTQNDVFTNSVNKDENISGFKRPGRKENLKLSQYADDTGFISTNFFDIPFIFKQFSKYKAATGCSLNKIIFKFLQNNKNPEPIAPETFFLPRERGGLGVLVPSIESQAL